MARRKDVEGQQSLGLEKGMVLSRDISGNKQARRLIALYKEAEKDIARKLLEMNGSTANARLMATQKKSIDAILKALRKRGTTIAEAMVEASYRGGFRSGRDELIQAGLVDGEVRPRMGSVHTKAMEVYSSQVLSRLSDVNTTAGRTVQDIYDQLQLNTVLSGALAGTETLTQVQRKMERLAADGGVTAFVDKSGRAWSMATYTEMLARTTTMQVYNKAKEIEFREHDEDLILVSTHYPTCDMCAPWNGAVLSLTGKTEGYATLQEAENDGLFHPNCRHTFSLYLEGVGRSDNPELTPTNGVTSSDGLTPYAELGIIGTEDWGWFSEFKDIRACLRETNPNFSAPGNGYRTNCQRCVYAYEMLRRGYAVTVKPAEGSNDITFRTTGWRQVFEGEKWLKTTGSGLEDIAAQMKKWGHGARAVIRIQRALSAHAFVVENVKGHIQFMDPQSNNIDARDEFKEALSNTTEFARVDNLKPTKAIRECCESM